MWGLTDHFPQPPPEARRLRDQAMEEHAKYVKRQAGQQTEAKKKAAEERRIAFEERKRTLEEKNRLAAENEQARIEEAEALRLRSKNAMNNLIESHKRRG